MRYKSALETFKVWLNPKYSQTRCPVCIFLVDVDPNGNMVEHGSGEQPCRGSGRNDEELAEELDRGEPIQTDGTRHRRNYLLG